MTDADDLERMFRLMNEIGIIAQLSGTAFERVMPDGLTMPQFVVLNHLARLGGNRTPQDLARAMQVTKGTMTNTLGHLERAAYVAITPDAKDGRAKRVDITERGRAARAAAIAAVNPELRAIADRLPAADVLAALPFLERLRRFLDERRNGP
jgi:DNA-binding MarR family transcriptional regulator